MKEKIKLYLKEIFSLKDGKASNRYIDTMIKSGVKIKGPNLCILGLAILIACIGLNMNSTATVIGAMLISPLMGGILGIAYGIATNDLHFARNSFFGLSLQVGICMIISTLYFCISPISTTSHELLARTTPTIWDVIVALAGGFAGIIGITRKDKSNVIPGVAIATAIMPPLCTAGFGIATHQWSYFGGALYLFFINAFFICLSSIIGLRLLKVPKVKPIDKKGEHRLHRNLAVIAVVTIIPSIYLAYNIVNETIIKGNIQSYITKEFDYEDTQVIDSTSDLKNKKIEVMLIGKVLDQNQIADLTKKLANYNLQDMNLKITQTEVAEGISKAEIETLISKQIGKADTKLASTQGTTVKSSEETENVTDKIKEIKSESTYNVDEIKEGLKQISDKIQDVSITKNKTVTQYSALDAYSIYVNIKITSDLTEEELTKIDVYLYEKLGGETSEITKELELQE